MKKATRRSEENATTRTAILDATQDIMREEGYAAVSSRRVAERAGLKSRLVHYHFGTMDDLFLAVIKRAQDRFLEHYARIMSSDHQLEEMWRSIMANVDSVIMSEFTALAIHRKAIRAETTQFIERVRGFDIAILGKALAKLGIDEETMPPAVLSVLFAGALRTLTAEGAIGVTRGHAETIAFIDGWIKDASRRIAARQA